MFCWLTSVVNLKYFWIFAKKSFEASWPSSDHSFLAIKGQNVLKCSFKVKHLIVAFSSRCKISASEVKACTESKISSQFLGFKVHNTNGFLPFSLSSPLFFLFCFAGHLLGFILVKKVWEKAFRIVRLDGKKCCLVEELDDRFFLDC